MSNSMNCPKFGAGAAMAMALVYNIAMAVEPAGNVDANYNVTSGYEGGFTVYPGGGALVIAREKFIKVTSEGVVDPTFKFDSLFYQVDSLCVMPGRKILIVGKKLNERKKTISLLTNDGTPDADFAPLECPMDYVMNIALQPDGKFLVGGGIPIGGRLPDYPTLLRFNSDGSLDRNFNAKVKGTVTAIAVQPDGKILVGGSFSHINDTPRNNFARLNSDGTVEPTSTFGIGTGADNSVLALALQPDGKILLGGWFGAINGNPRNQIARLAPNGALDTTTSFATPALSDGTNDRLGSLQITGLALQTDGRFIVAGTFKKVGPFPLVGIARLLSNGTLEGKDKFHLRTSREASGALKTMKPLDKIGIPRALLQDDGRILFGALNYDIAGGFQNHVVRLSNETAKSTLGAVNASTVYWLRSGTAPELSFVLFEVSKDNGATWQKLGNGTRIRGGWQCTGLNIPANGTLRASGWVQSSFRHGYPGVVETTAPYSLRRP